MISSRVRAVLSFAFLAVTVAACGGGGSSVSAPAAAVSTPTPVASAPVPAPLVAPTIAAIAPFSVATSAPFPTPSAGATSVTVALPPNPVATASLTLPVPTAGFSANATLAEVVANAVPATLVPFSGARSVQTARTPNDASPATVLLYFSLLSSANATLPGTPGGTFTFAPGFLPNAAFYIAFYNPLTPSLGWQRGYSPIGRVDSTRTQVTFASGSTPIAFTAGVPLEFVVYAISYRAPGPTPAPSATPIVDAPLVNGQKMTYNVTTSTSYVPGPEAPSPYPYTNTSNVTSSNTVTVSDNQTFKGVANLFDLQKVHAKPATSTATTYNVVDNNYEGFSLTATGADLLSYGFYNTSNITSSTGNTSATIFDQSNVSSPQVVSRFPNANASFDVAQPYTLVYSQTNKNSAGVVTFQYNLTNQQLNADGSFTYSDSGSQPAFNYTFADSETLSPPPFAGSLVFSQNGYTNDVQTAGAPVADSTGKYFIPYTHVYGVPTGSSPAPSPKPTMVPMWYPNGPTSLGAAQHVNQLGVQKLPAACTLPAGISTTVSAVESIFTQFDPFGLIYTSDRTNYIAPGIGSVCSVSVATQVTVDPATGKTISTSTTNTTTVLSAYTMPQGASRRTLSVGAGAAGVADSVTALPLQRHLPRN